MKQALLDWAVASRTRAGETISGDRSIVVTQPDGVLVAVADGLGHGAEAARAAELAMQTVEKFAAAPLVDILRRCHDVLVRSRGVALSLARWDLRDRVVTWVGVGNVEALLQYADGGSRPASRRLVLRSGVVGVRLPALLASPVAVPGQALLVLATDGITDRFEQELRVFGRPQTLADQILARHARETDDATVLIARLEG